MGAVTVPAAETVSGDIDLLGGIRTVLAGATLDLYKSSFSPTPDSVVADFDAAKSDFTGYANQVLVWSPVAVDVDGNVVIVSSRAFFQGDDPLTVTDSVGGAYVKTAGGALIRYYPFPAPVNIDAALKYIAMEITLGVCGGEADVEY